MNKNIVKTILEEVERLNVYPKCEISFPFITRYRGEISVAVHCTEITLPRKADAAGIRKDKEEYMTIFFECSTGLAKAYEYGIQKTNENYITEYTGKSYERYLEVLDDILAEYNKTSSIAGEKYAIAFAELVEYHPLISIRELIGRSLYKNEIWKHIANGALNSTKLEAGKIHV